MTELQNGLPPGWDTKFDEKSGKYYFVNHYTRTTTWEDPRLRHRPLSATPKHLSKVPVEHIPLQELKTTTRSPLTLRGARVQDSSFTSSHPSTDSDDSVAKLRSMFPTVSETHIKLLLKNCRYMKSIFPNADETVILECLQNNENSIQKTSDILKEMGYSQKEIVITLTPKAEPKVVKAVEVEPDTIQSCSPALKVKTNEEKEEMKKILQERYKDVPEHLISIALESVNFNNDRANQILQIMIQEDTDTLNNKNKKVEESTRETSVPVPPTIPTQLPVSQSRQSIKSLLKSEKKEEVGTFGRIIDEHFSGYKSTYLCNTFGHNPDLSKGPSEKLLLENYVQWQGRNKSLQKGPQGFAKGPNKALLSQALYSPCGPNKDLRKGSSCGLAKGSIFTQMKSTVLGEYRVK